jgi:hypothetical protein
MDERTASIFWAEEAADPSASDIYIARILHGEKLTLALKKEA